MKQFRQRHYSRAFLPALLIMLFPALLQAQQIAIKGTVKDQTGEIVTGANVLEKGTINGTITDVNGSFNLTVAPNATLVISFIGYQTQEVAATPTMNIIMKDDTQLLDDIVVIGYGTMRKSDLSGSVVAIKADEINRGAVTSPQELLQGKIPGLFVQPGDGQPGAGSTLRIRSGASLNASNDPLIVIDGVPVSNDAAPGTPNALAMINPNDIETFTVLKDASATAIYGSRASNGVIIITTKKGLDNKGIKVGFSGTYSLRDPHQRLDVMSAQEFRTAITQYYPTGTEAGDRAQGIINLFPNQETDWQDQIFRTAFSSDENINLSGKVKTMPYRFSFGITDEDGTLKTSNYKRYTIGLNVSPTFFNGHLKADINAKFTINKNRFADADAVRDAAFYDPTKPVHNDTGAFNGFWNFTTDNGDASDQASINPLSRLYDRNNKGKTRRLLGNIQLDYKVHGFEDLRLNLNLGYDYAKSKGNNYINEGSFQAARGANFTNIGDGVTWNDTRKNELIDFYVNYTKNLTSIQSHFDVMAGYSWQHFYFSSHNINKSNPMVKLQTDPSGWQYSDPEGRYIQDGSRKIPFENYLVSFFGRFNYNFMDRYLLTATLRRDGSSRFDKDNRWGMFPSAAFAWSIINEPFMNRTKSFMSNLKLRFGYGITGQQEIGDYQYIPSYVFGTEPVSKYLGSFLLKPNGYSPELKWEQTTTYNVAIDYGFLNNRINGSIELYKKHTKDLLNTVSAPAGTNFINEIVANVGEMKNRGIEFNINAVVIQTKDFSWNLGYNVTWNDSEITRLTYSYNPNYPGIIAGSAPYGSGTPLQKHIEGYAPFTFWLFQQVYGEDGKPIYGAFVDRNKDGQITEADRYMTNKNPMADVFMGLSSQFTYKNWDLGFNLRANFGNYVYNALAADNSTISMYNGNEHINNLYRAVYRTGFTYRNVNQNQRSSDLYLENASFLKMDNITLGYSFDQLKLFKLRLSGRISASVQNVFTITDYTGLDPECASIDFNLWPRPVTYTLGLSFNF